MRQIGSCNIMLGHIYLLSFANKTPLNPVVVARQCAVDLAAESDSEGNLEPDLDVREEPADEAVPVAGPSTSYQGPSASDNGEETLISVRACRLISRQQQRKRRGRAIADR